MSSVLQPVPALILRRAKVPAFLVTDLKNIRYLTGMELSAGCVMIRSKKIELFVDARYFEYAHKNVNRGVVVRPIGDLEILCKKLPKIGIESEQLTLDRFGKWKKKYKNTKFIQTVGIIAEFRRRKSSEELRRIRRACLMSLKVLRNMPTLLKRGITEKELVWKIECECRRMGADRMAFDTIVAFGENSAVPHHHPTDRALKQGDLVQIDMGAEAEGYASDFSRVYFFETSPTAEQKRALQALKKSKTEAEKLVRIGVSNHALDRCARAELKKFGFEKEFSHALGHGLGLDIHEGVTISSKAPLQKLLRNEVITIEPGLYFEGRWGMRLEDTIIVSR